MSVNICVLCELTLTFTLFLTHSRRTTDTGTFMIRVCDDIKVVDIKSNDASFLPAIWSVVTSQHYTHSFTQNKTMKPSLLGFVMVIVKGLSL